MSDATPTPAPAPAADAILVPREYPPGVTTDLRHEALRAEFAPVLGTTHVATRHYGTSQSFVVGGSLAEIKSGRLRAGHARNHPKGHPLEGRDRFAWVEARPGVFHGTLIPEADADAGA